MDIDIPYIQLLDENAQVKDDLPDLSDDQIRTMYWWMALTREFNAKLLNLQKQGRMGTFASILGQEGAQAGIAMAIKDVDTWIAQSFRETLMAIARDYPMEDLMRYWGGFEIGMKHSRQHQILPVSIPIASQMLHAAGLGMAMAFRGEKQVALGFCGDGGTSEGDFSAALNFAGEFNAPVVFIVQNNQYAISVSRTIQTRSKTLAQKAIAFGFDGVQCDGNDPFACYKVTKEAVDKALNGGGPTLIEMVTYRLDNHTTADDWHKYRSEEEVAEAQKKDPMLRMRKFMEEREHWNEEHQKGMMADAKKKVDEATKKYEETPKPEAGEMFDYQYEKPTQHLEEQKKQWGGA